MLSITDAAWLLTESPETPQHVGGLLTFELPRDAGPDFLRERWEAYRDATEVVPPFSYRLARPYGLAGTFSWVEDEGIDLDYHLRLSALPRPGRVRELFVLVSRLHTQALDRHRPLWEMHLIEGLEPAAEGAPERFAIYTKTHHSLFDGVGAMRMMKKIFTTDPDERDMPPLWQVETRRTRRASQDNAVQITEEKRRDLLAPFKSAATVGSALTNQFVNRKKRVVGEVLPFSAPASVLNRKITAARRFAADGWELDRIRSTAKALEVTINDVVLAMCSHALREYLVAIGELPQRDLTAMIPVSIRGEGEDDGGNSLSFVICDLGTSLPDPASRLERIHTSMETGKARLATMTRTERIGYALAITSPYLLGPALGTAGHGRPVANVVISNVPGPQETMYLEGAKLTGFYPASLLQQGNALNITLTSYDGEVQFGITAARESLPGVQRMLALIEDGLSSLEKLASAMVD